MKYYETHDLSYKQKKHIRKQGLHVYDLRLDDDCVNLATIEKKVWVNKCGSMITNFEIPIGSEYGQNYMDYEKFTKENEKVNSIEDLFAKPMTNNQIVIFSNEVLGESEYSNCEIQYIIKNRDEFSNCFVVATDGDISVGFNPFEEDFFNYSDWAFNIDEDLFKGLEWNKEIIFMTPNCHFGIWVELSKYYPEEFTYLEGVNEYLKYCKDKGITINKILEIGTHEDLKDVLKFLPEEEKDKKINGRER